MPDMGLWENRLLSSVGKVVCSRPGADSDLAPKHTAQLHDHLALRNGRVCEMKNERPPWSMLSPEAVLVICAPGYCPGPC